MVNLVQKRSGYRMDFILSKKMIKNGKQSLKQWKEFFDNWKNR